MAKQVSWKDLKTRLNDTGMEEIIPLIKGLYDLSPENKAFITAKILPNAFDRDYLEKCRKEIEKAIYPNNIHLTNAPYLGKARKTILTYKKSTQNLEGTIDLMLFYVEIGTQLTLDFGDMNEAFYSSLETMLENCIDLLIQTTDAANTYTYFQSRFDQLLHKAPSLGWGYGDHLFEVITDLKTRFGD